MLAVRSSVLVLAVMFGCAPLGAAEHTKDSVPLIKERLAKKQAVLLDVRDLQEWQRGHLQDARLLPLGELKKAATEPAARAKVEKDLPKERIVYCHCAKGVRALMAAELLTKMGYDARPLAAGYDQLHSAGLPAAKK